MSPPEATVALGVQLITPAREDVGFLLREFGAESSRADCLPAFSNGVVTTEFQLLRNPRRSDVLVASTLGDPSGTVTLRDVDGPDAISVYFLGPHIVSRQDSSPDSHVSVNTEVQGIGTPGAESKAGLS